MPNLKLSQLPTALTGAAMTDLDRIYVWDQSEAGILGSKYMLAPELILKIRATIDSIYSAAAHTHSFASLTAKPTTLAGYGITDALTQAAADALYSVLGHTHSFASLTAKPTTLAGYGIVDAAALAHSHPAADIVSGLIATARLGTGTADATTFLRGDQTYATPAGGGSFLPLAGGTMTGTIVALDITIPSKTNFIKIGTYGTISETGGGLAYITGNSIKSDPAVDSQLIKTSNDPGHLIRMRYDQGISFHTILVGVTGSTYADSANQGMRLYGDTLRFGPASADSQGIAKSAADILEVNNGNVGTFRDLKLRDLIINGATNLLKTSAALTDNAGAAAGTLTNAPAVGNPTKWVRVDDNGTARFLPLW